MLLPTFFGNFLTHYSSMGCDSIRRVCRGSHYLCAPTLPDRTVHHVAHTHSTSRSSRRAMGFHSAMGLYVGTSQMFAPRAVAAFASAVRSRASRTTFVASDSLAATVSCGKSELETPCCE